jgi:preprotein translocase subunit Sec63
MRRLNKLKQLSMKYHPDRTVKLDEKEREVSNAKYLQIKLAYDILSDPMRRENYDLEQSNPTPPPVQPYSYSPPPPSITPTERLHVRF